METVQLQVKQRENMSKAHLKEMRRQGFIPGTLYGKEKASVPIEVGLMPFKNALTTDAGIHAVFNLEVEGSKADTAVVKNIQKDPISRKVLHIDFVRVSMSDVVTSTVPIETHGEAAGTRAGGSVEQVMTELVVKSRADHIPPRIDLDISNLELGDIVRASDVVLPEGVELVSRPDDVVISVHLPHVRAAAEGEVLPEGGAIPETEAPKPAAE